MDGTLEIRANMVHIGCGGASPARNRPTRSPRTSTGDLLVDPAVGTDGLCGDNCSDAVLDEEYEADPICIENELWPSAGTACEAEIAAAAAASGDDNERNVRNSVKAPLKYANHEYRSSHQAVSAQAAACSRRCDKSGSARSSFDSLNLQKINCQ